MLGRTSSELEEIRAEVKRASQRDADFGEEEVARFREGLDREKASWQSLEQLFQKIRQAKLCKGPMPDADFNEIEKRMNPQYGVRHTACVVPAAQVRNLR